MTYRTIAFLAALVLALLGSGRSALADVSVMVPPHAEQLASAELLEQAIEELTRLLKVHGFDVISAGQAGPAAEAEQQRGVFPQGYDPLYCLTPECANEYRKLFDATFAVQLTIFSRGVRASSVSVVLTESPKAFFSGTAPVEGRDIRAAVRAAFELAREKQEEGAGPWLTVQGSPEGAMVYVDGAEYGQLPFTKRHVEAGPHRFEARAEGYLPETRTLNIAGRVDHVELVTVALDPTLAVSRSDPTSRRRPVQRSVWDYVLGGGIAAAGAVHLVSGVYQKTRAGDCVEDAQCSERYQSHPRRENLLIGLGATGVALGAVVIGLGPIGQLQLRAGADHARLQLQGSF
jgi:hypothetical protein